MTFLEQEIAQQPQVLARLIQEKWDTARQIAKAVRNFNPTFVCIAARGTSDNAARYAQYLLGVYAGLSVGLAAPSLHTIYDAAPNLSRALVIGISQSGQAEDVRQVLEDARRQGALTVSITNDAESPMAATAEYHLPICAEEEVSIAATKTYTAQLAAVALLTAAITEKDELYQLVKRLPDWATETLSLSESVAGWAERYRYMTNFAALGRGFNYCTAFEISLKVKELCYITGEGYSEADFRHGPIAVIQPGFPVVIVTPSGKTQPTMVDLLEKLQERQAENLVISDDESAFKFAQKAMKLPAGIPEWLSPILAVMPGQVFALHLAQVKGYPVDKPRGLSKVTVTK